jgi:hypothetical protein
VLCIEGKPASAGGESSWTRLTGPRILGVPERG